MSSFRHRRDMLVLAYDNEIISDEECLVFYEHFWFKNPEFRLICTKTLTFKMLMKQSVYQTLKYEKKTSLYLPTLFDFLQSSSDHNEQCATKLKAYVCFLRRFAYHVKILT